MGPIIPITSPNRGLMVAEWLRGKDFDTCDPIDRWFESEAKGSFEQGPTTMLLKSKPKLVQN